MANNDDQEWETAVNLSKLQLAQNKASGEEEAESGLSAPLAPPVVIKADKAESNFVAVATPEADSPVDESVRSALFNPRERTNVLYIEKFVFDFAQTSDISFNVPPMANSFQRMLVYRIAQRFNIGHQTSDIFYSNGERGITLFKTPSTFTPKTLLIDILHNEQPPESNTESPPNVNRAAPPIAKGKKVKVMKRSTSGNSIDKGDKQAGRRQETLDDKEKAYEEARARIFGVEPSASPDSAAAASPTAPAPTPVAENSDKKAEAPDNPAASPTGTAEAAAAADKPASQPRKTGKKGKNVDTTSWTGNKAITRDKFAEQADPDFARNHRYSAPMQYANQPYGPPGPYGGHPVAGPYGPPMAGYGDYGMPMPPPHGYHDPRYGYVNNNVYGPPAGYYPPQPRIADSIHYGDSYGQPARRQPPPPNRSPPPADTSNFPPLG